MRRRTLLLLMLGALPLGACATPPAPSAAAPRDHAAFDNSRFLRANRSGAFPIDVPTRDARALIRS